MNTALLLPFLFCGPVDCQPPPATPTETAGMIIDSVTVEIGDIFDLGDPREDRFLFRIANRLHRNTRSSVVRHQLLFHRGDPLDPKALDETERLLRESRYLSDAQIKSSTNDHQHADVVVQTRDTWSLTGGVSFGRSGGANRSSIELTDTNFLGTGKEVVLRETFGIDRDTLLARYVDPNLRGSRYRLAAEVSDNSDGERWQLELGLPFFALDSRRSVGLAALSDRRITPLYRRGIVINQLFQESRRFEISRGFSRGLVDGQTHRWTIGLAYEQERFANVIEDLPSMPESTIALADRTFAYPWVAFERVGDTFLETQNIDRIGRTEDRYIGTRFSARLGVSPRAFSGDRGRVLLAAALSHTREPTSESLLDLTTAVTGRWATGGFENVRWTGEAKYYHQVWDRHRFFARLKLGFDRRLDADRQLLLGGDNGLRGYPLRFQDGDRFFLLTLEQRFFTPWSLFRLADVGAAVFFDVGRAWTPGTPQDAGSGVLADVGLGLRLGLNRSGTGTVLHIDLAIPLNDTGGDLDSLQFLVSSRQSF